MLAYLSDKGQVKDEIPTSVQTDEQTCAEFANLMDHIHHKK